MTWQIFSKLANLIIGAGGVQASFCCLRFLFFSLSRHNSAIHFQAFWGCCSPLSQSPPRSMDLDDYDYLEKAVERSEPLTDLQSRAEYRERRKGDKDRRKHSAGCRRSRVSDETTNCRHERHKHDAHSKRRGFPADGAESIERDWDRSERDLKKARRRLLCDRERWEQDNRERKRRDKDWNRERMGGWGLGGRERFSGNSHFRGRAGEREGRHFDKQVDVEHGLSDEHQKLEGSREWELRYFREKREKKEAAASTELEVDPERDQRTVFAHQISLKADERDVYEFFSKVGKVQDVRLIMDRKSRRSKGVGYVEFYDAMSVPMAIAMTGQLLLGQPVIVKPSKAGKNLSQSAQGASGAIDPYSGSARRLYVGNLQYDITDAQLRQVFEPFGPVEFVHLSMEAQSSQSKGYAFIQVSSKILVRSNLAGKNSSESCMQFAKPEDAHCAQTSLNGTLKLGGRFIKVLAVTEPTNRQERGGTGELDGDEDGGVPLTPWSRTLLMQKLDRSGTVTSITGGKAASLPVSIGHLPGAPIPATNSPPLMLGSTLAQPGMTLRFGLSNTALATSIGTPSECLWLKNMFDPSTEMDADFDLDIKDEVQSECSKFGSVKHIYVDKDYAYLCPHDSQVAGHGFLPVLFSCMISRGMKGITMPVRQGSLVLGPLG